MRSIARWASALVVLAACTPFGGSNGGDGDGGTSGNGGGTTSDGGPSAGSATGSAEVLVAGLTNPQFVNATSGGVYWMSIIQTDAGGALRLHRCALEGCRGGAALLLDERVDRLAADDSGVYWGSGEQLRRCELGATCTPSSIGSTIMGFYLLVAADGTLILGTGDGPAGSLRRCDASRCSDPFWSGDRLGVITASGGDVYFTAGTQTSHLYRFSGASAAQLGAVPSGASAIAAVGTHVFVIAQRTLYHCSAEEQCSLVPFAPPGTAIFDVRVVGDQVIYTVEGRGGVPGRIMRCPQTDCSAPSPVHEGGNPRWLSAHEGWIYFADGGDGDPSTASIRRIRIPTP